MDTEQFQALTLLKDVFPLAKFTFGAKSFFCWIETSFDLHKLTVKGLDVTWESWYYDFDRHPQPYDTARDPKTLVRKFHGSWCKQEMTGWVFHVKDYLTLGETFFVPSWVPRVVHPLPNLAELCWGHGKPTPHFPHLTPFSASRDRKPSALITFIRPGDPNSLAVLQSLVNPELTYSFNPDFFEEAAKEDLKQLAASENPWGQSLTTKLPPFP